MDQKERQRAVLAAIVEEYVRTNEPVGSKALAEVLGNTVSSATIRNDMADLSAEGYLEQPHTSAGRVPTAKAYRLYINELMQRHPLSPEKRREIEHLVEAMADDPDKLTENAAQALAYFTGCAAVTTSPERTGTCIRRIDWLRVSPQTAVLILMTDAGVLQNRLCRFDAPVSDEWLNRIGSILSGAFVGRPLNQVDLPQIQSLVGALGDQALFCMPALTVFADLVRDSCEADVALSGQMNLLQFPDFEKQHARQLMHFLSHRRQIARMISPAEDRKAGTRVLLGNESSLPELNGSSLIVARYSAGDKAGGSLGIIGPQRMDYAAAIPELEYFATLVGRILANWTQQGG
ncbi:MAG: heat-inducible transcription repressor HrcA [Clostridia bacterium]|nr:heat-inducible transcription repressor HrcA [Clostridia bacterium]